MPVRGRRTITVSETIHVERSPEAVFDYTQDYGTRTDWDDQIARAVVVSDPERVADAERRYEQRYRKPRVNPQRVVIEITVTKVLGNA